MMPWKKLMLSFCAAFCGAAASAETFYWNGQAGKNAAADAVIGSQFACWTNETQTTAVAPSAGNDYVLRATKAKQTAQTVNSNSANVFPGASLTFDSAPDIAAGSSLQIYLKSPIGINWEKRTTNSVTTCGNFIWKRGRLTSNTGGSMSYADELKRNFAQGLSGRMTIVNADDGGEEQHLVLPGGSDLYGPRNFMLACDLTSEAGVVVTCEGMNKQGEEERLGGVRLFLAGNNASFKGSFQASNWHTVSLFADDALGDMGTPNPAALVLGTNGGFEVNPLSRQGTTRGVTLAADSTGAFVTTHPSDVVTNAIPIAGEGVPFRSIGEGTLTYAGAYSAGTWTVEKGVLVVPEEASFPKGHEFVVKSGATLRLASSQLANCHVTCEDGGLLVCDAIPYDDETGVATPLDYSKQALPALPWRLKLSTPVTHAGDLRLEVLRIPLGSTLTTDDLFVDPDDVVSPIFVTFEIVAGESYKSVYMNVRDHSSETVSFTPEAVAASTAAVPTVFTLASTLSKTVDGEEVYTWSDRQLAHSGSHYLVEGGRVRTVEAGWQYSTFEFPGESLRVLSGGTIQTYHTNTYFKSVYFGPGAVFEGMGCGMDEAPHWLSGDVYVGGTAKSPVCLKSRFGYSASNGRHAMNPIRVAGRLRGDGYVKFGGSSLCDFGVDSTNAAFKGGIIVETKGDALTNCALAVRNPLSLGGPLDADDVNFNALVFDGKNNYCGLKPLETMTLETSGRGILIRDPTTAFCVPEGVTLTVKEPIRSAVNGFRKTGRGTLAIAGALGFGESGAEKPNGSYETLRLVEGGLKVVNGTTLVNEKVFVDGDVWLVCERTPVDATVAKYGYLNKKTTSFVFAEGASLTIALEGLAAILEETPSSFRVVVCTVSNAGDTSSTGQAADRVRAHLTLPKVRGYAGTVVEDVPAEYSGMIRFTAEYVKKGVWMVVR